MTASVLSAAPMYTIHLNNSEQYTECTVVYRSDTTTKFRGKDKSGKNVTKEVPSATILAMREVQAKPAPAPAAPQTPEKSAPTDEKPADTKGEEKPGETEAEAPAPPPEPEFRDANIQQKQGEDKAKDVTLRLREKLQEIDKRLAEIKKPSRTLRSICTNTTNRINSQMAEMDKLSLEVAELQSKFNAAGIADYQFTVSPEQRERFLSDASAAYNAMLIDMKEKKSRRKVGGLDKFEILFERYQGAPEYKKAHEWYLKTLRDLQKKWSRMIAAEQKKRSKLQPARASAMDDSDREEYQKMVDYFKRNGEDAAKVWYTPSSRNLMMLNNCLNKVNDNLRRNEYTKLDAEVGCVPELLTQFWDVMEKARNELVCGRLDAAEKILRDDETVRKISSLKSTTMPQEYRKPLLDENRAIVTEIRKRERELRSLKGTLERRTNQLDRAVSSAEAQITNALEAIEREKAMQTEDETLEIVGETPEDKKAADSKKAEEPKKDAAPQQPAEQQKDAEPKK